MAQGSDSSTRPLAPPFTDPTHTREPSLTAPRPAAGDPPESAPALFGNPERYVIIEEHGRGGLGRVSRAHDRGLGRDVAIKELLSRGPVSEVRFFREVLITARLEHPGIVPIHEAGRWPDGTPFYAMKLVSGRSLRELIAERTTIDERIDLLHHVIAVADAVAYAHDRNIIHRDLKPANVIVGEFGETIVIDWGLAKDLTAPDDAAAGGRVHGTPDDGLTATGSVLGTPSYMAPEQERGQPVDQRADVFAIGAMLWELCAVEKLASTDVRQRHRMLRRGGIDDDLIAIIEKACDPDPDRRYPHAGALAADLRAFKSGARIAARSYSLYAMLTHWTRRHRTLALSAIAFAGLLLVSIAALAVLYRSSSRNAATAQRRLIQAYDEQGRRLLLDGEYLRALPYLAEAYAQGDRSTGLRFMLARAERLASSQLAMHTHSGRAHAAAFRPDGSHVLSVSEDGEAAIWDAQTGRVVASLPARPGGPHDSAISRDGAFVAIVDGDRVTLWDGVHARTLATGPVQRCAIDASGTRIAVVAGSELSTWDAATGKRIWTTSTEGPSRQLAWSGDAVVVVGVDTIARIADGHTVVRLAATGPVYALSVGSRGEIATVSHNLVELWSTAGARLARIEERSALAPVAFSPTASRIVVVSNDALTILYDTATGAPQHQLAAHRGIVVALGFSDDGTLLATAGSDLSVRIWDTATHRLIATLLGARGAFSRNEPRFDRAGKRLVVATGDGAVRVFATADPEVRTGVDAGPSAQLGQFHDGGRRFSASSENGFRIWSTATGDLLGRVDVPDWSMASLSPDASKVAIVKVPNHDANPDGGAEIRDVATQGLLARLPGSERYWLANFDHASKRLVTSSFSNQFELWNLRGERLATFHGHKGRVTSGSFSRDDRRLISSSDDKTVRIWDTASGRELGQTTLAGPTGNVELDATGTRFVTSGADRFVRLWDARSFLPLQSFEHLSLVTYATISPDGRLIASFSVDGTVSVWDVSTSSLLTQFHQTPMLGDVAFSPDGDLLLCNGGDRAVVRYLGLEDRPPEVVAAFVRCHSPYRLVETRLDPTTPICPGE